MNSGEGGRMRHGHVVVRDDQELSLRAQPREHLAEPADVGVVECGVDLVEDGEGARIDLIERENQRERGQGTLAAREKRDVLEPLTRRLDQDLDTCAGALVAIRMLEGRASSRSQLREVLVEVRGDGADYGFVPRLLFRAQLADQLLQIRARRRDVLELGAQRFEALFELAALAVRQRVGGTDLFEAPLQGAHLALARLATGNLLRRDAIRHSRADLLHASFEELGLASDELEVAFESAGLEAGVDARLLQRDPASRALRHLILVLQRLQLRRGPSAARWLR